MRSHMNTSCRDRTRYRTLCYTNRMLKDTQEIESKTGRQLTVTVLDAEQARRLLESIDTSTVGPRTTKLYGRTGDVITLDEVERITI